MKTSLKRFDFSFLIFLLSEKSGLTLQANDQVFGSTLNIDDYI